MVEFTLSDLVRNGTMSAEIASFLRKIVNKKISFLTVALPRNAGKSTVTEAIFAEKNPKISLHYTSGEKKEIEELKKKRLGGYLVVAEFSKYPAPGYIWGEDVGNVFKLTDYGYSLQACMHAESPQDAIEIITQEIGVDDKHASHIKFVLYIEMFEKGRKIERRLAEIYEVFSIKDGKPLGQILFKWNKKRDIFEKLSEPKQFATDKKSVEKRLKILNKLV